MPYTINNPGGGDCGFYAFAVGLISIIQQEHSLKGKSTTFDQWQKAGLSTVSLQDILDFDLNRLYRSPHDYKSNQLFLLQSSLRAISVNTYKRDLFNRIKTEQEFSDKKTIIEGSPVYFKFMELVHYYSTHKGSLSKISHFNELALSPEVLKLAKETAQSLKPKLYKKSVAERQKIENSHVKEAFMKDVVLKNGAINPDSIIVKGTDKIKEPGRWATHSDLREIAAPLQVNLSVKNKPIGSPSPDYPTVSLVNSSNIHWTTTVDRLSSPKHSAVSHKRVHSEEHQNESEATRSTSSTLPKEIENNSTKPRKKEKNFSVAEEQVISATVSTQSQSEKIEQYREHLKELIQASSTLGLFANVKNKIDVNAIDSAEATYDTEKGKMESDESFAARLQEAELRRAKLK